MFLLQNGVFHTEMIELTTDDDGVEEEPPPSDDAVPVTHGIDDDNDTEKQHATDKSSYNSRVQLTYKVVGGLSYLSFQAQSTLETEETEKNFSQYHVLDDDNEILNIEDFAGEATLAPESIEQLLATTTLSTDNITFMHWYQLDQDLPGEIDILMRGFREVHEDLGDQFIAFNWQMKMGEKNSERQDIKLLLRALQPSTGEVYAKNRYQK